MYFLNISEIQRSLWWIPRSASTSLSRAILTKYYPDSLSFEKFKLPEGITEPPLQLVIPSSPMLPEGFGFEGCAVLREPIARFLSACSHCAITVEEGITELNAGKGRDFLLLRPYTSTLPKGLKLFRFEDQLENAAEWLGITELGAENASVVEITPTEEQLTVLQEVYAKDIELYNSIPDIVLEPRWAPAEVPLWAFSAELKSRNLWDSVLALIAQLPTEAKLNATEFLEKGTYVSKHSDTLKMLAHALGKTEEEIDDIFISANERRL